MRIALLADSWLHDPSTMVNGTQVQMRNLASAFRRRGHEVHYVSLTPDRGALTALPEDIRFHWIERRTTALSWLRDLADFREALDRIAPDVVYQRGRSHLTWIAARWARAHGRPFVWGSNGEDSCTHWKHVTRILASPRRAWRKALLCPLAATRDVLVHAGIRGASHVVTQTRGQAESLLANFGKEGRVLPSTFEGPPARPVAKERLVLWLASLAHAKQPELFLELAERCRDLGGWTFVLGGGTRVESYRRGLESRAATLPGVRLQGPVPFAESDALYARAALFVNTSRMDADGLPNSFIQAWLHGAPVLSLHHDPNGWIASHGLGVCAHGDMERFVAAGRALLQDDAAREATGERCVRFARETFATEETIDDYLALFAR